MRALQTAERCLDDLAMLHGLDGRTSPRQAHRVLGMICSELELAPPAELLEDVYQVTERVQSACSVAGDAIGQRYFPHGVVTSWMVNSVDRQVPHRPHVALRVRPQCHGVVQRGD